MVGHDPHGDIRFFAVAVSFPRQCSDRPEHRLKKVGIIVGMFALQHANQAFEAHPRIDDMHRKRFERSVGLPVELHEHNVPYLDDLRIIFVHLFPAGDLCLFCRCARVDMDFGTRSAGARVSHLPEIIVFVPIDDVIGGKVLAPIACRLLIAWNIFGGGAFENGNVEIVRIYVQHLHQIFPGEVDRTFFKIVTEAPVS